MVREIKFEKNNAWIPELDPAYSLAPPPTCGLINPLDHCMQDPGVWVHLYWSSWFLCFFYKFGIVKSSSFLSSKAYGHMTSIHTFLKTLYLGQVIHMVSSTAPHLLIEIYFQNWFEKNNLWLLLVKTNVKMKPTDYTDFIVVLVICSVSRV